MKVVSEKNLHMATCVICGLLVVMGLLIVISLAVLQTSVDGECLLYADSREYGPKSVCAYPIAVATIFQFCYCIARFVLTLLLLLGILSTKVLSPRRFTVPCAIADVIVCLLTLVSAGIISHGFSVMCSNVFFPKSDRCGTVGIYIAATDSFVEEYYQRLNVAEIGVWPSWVLWILLVVVDVLYLLRSGVLQELPFSLPFSLPSFDSKDASTAPSSANKRSTTRAATTRPTGDTSRVAHLRPVAAGSRTPPPVRPVPPRPDVVPPVSRPLMPPGTGQDSDEEVEVRPIYRRTVAPT